MTDTGFEIRDASGVGKIIDSLGSKVALRIEKASLSAGGREGAKLVRREIPSLAKSVRKAIGNRVKKTASGLVGKFGTTGKRSAAQSANRRERPGVGISSQNVHWYLLGTNRRVQSTTGRYTGQMPASSAVRDAVSKGRPAILAAIMKAARKVYEKAAAGRAR